MVYIIFIFMVFNNSPFYLLVGCQQIYQIWHINQRQDHEQQFLESTIMDCILPCLYSNANVPMPYVNVSMLTANVPMPHASA